MFLLPLIICLPFLEIAGFIVIGGHIGLGLSLLWLVADVVAGLAVLRRLGTRAFRSAQDTATEEDALEDMFDGFCLFAGAMLLIFPGFVSDFLALPLLVPPFRHLIFAYLKGRHGGLLNNINTTSQGFTAWYGPTGARGAKTIDGEFRVTEDEKKLQ